MSRAGRSGFAAFVLVLLAGLAQELEGQSQIDLLGYASRVTYSGSQVKTEGWVAGGYGTYGTGLTHLVELGGVWTGLDFTDGSTLTQWDVTAAYNYFRARGSLRVGAHYLSTTDSRTDGGFVLFGGGSVYRLGSWTVGAEGAWSHYPDYGPALEVLQIAPSAGFTTYPAEGRYVLGGTLTAYFVHLTEEVGLEDTNFASLEAAGSLTRGRLTFTASGWVGEQAFAVRSAGFLAFNLSELHTGGFGAGARVVLSSRTALSVGYSVERFQDLGFDESATARTFTLSLGVTPWSVPSY
jgi:hypothetical protein